MEQLIANLLSDFERGKLSRRQLIQSLALASTAVAAVEPSAAADARVFEATSINHVSYQVADYAKTRDFYSGLLGMKVSDDDGKQCRLAFGNNSLIVRTRPSNTPHVDHLSFTVDRWDKDQAAVADELKRRGIKIVRGDAGSVHVMDPDGFDVQFGGADQ